MQRRNVFAVLNGIDGSLIIYLLGNGLSRHNFLLRRFRIGKCHLFLIHKVTTDLCSVVDMI